MDKSKYIIEVKDLTKSYGRTEVLKGINLKVERGKMLALLGPNGAGKTTTIRILSTLLAFNGGTATVGGYDVKKQENQVRKIIGLTGQSAAIDELLTGRENLVMMGRLYRLTRDSAKERAQELLEDFDLVEAGDRMAKTYSGGMRRRLDLAVSLIATPPIIFLDEPTTGLDPRSRLAMWAIIKKLLNDKTTILLTTQYLEEADQLADRIAVIDDGRVIAEGTPKELKSKVGKDRFELTLSNQENLAKAEKALSGFNTIVDIEEFTISVVIENTDTDIHNILHKLKQAEIKLASLAVHKPTLDDVFLTLTGKHKVTDETEGGK